MSLLVEIIRDFLPVVSQFHALTDHLNVAEYESPVKETTSKEKWAKNVYASFYTKPSI